MLIEKHVPLREILFFSFSDKLSCLSSTYCLKNLPVCDQRSKLIEEPIRPRKNQITRSEMKAPNTNLRAKMSRGRAEFWVQILLQEHQSYPMQSKLEEIGFY